VNDEKIAVIMGASYAQGWDVQEIAGLKVQNVGIDGQESHELLQRFPTDVIDREPAMVVIWGYINDIHRNPRDEIEATKTRARESFIQMIDDSSNAGIVPVVATEVTIRGPEGWSEDIMKWLGSLLGKESYQDFVNRHVHELNEWLRDYAKERGVMLLDFERELAGADGVRKREYTSEDGSHLTEAAYARLTDYALHRLPDPGPQSPPATP
jgi:lysophospholipase L1-like esterase